MRRDQRDSDFSAGQTHREIFYTAAFGEKFGLPGEFKARLIHARLVNRSCHNSVDFAASRERDRLLKRGCGRSRGFNRWLAWFTIGLAADDDVFD